jgi:hypothetical protein
MQMTLPAAQATIQGWTPTPEATARKIKGLLKSAEMTLLDVGTGIEDYPGECMETYNKIMAEAVALGYKPGE